MPIAQLALFAGFGILLCFFVLSSRPLFAADHPTTPREWLDAMASAAHQQNYAGTFTYLNNGSLQSVRLIHGHDDVHGERDRLVSLSGSEREVLRDAEQVTCILPDKVSVKVEHGRPGRPIPLIIPTQLERIGKYYEFAFAGNGRVAGRSTRKVMITPRDDHRYSHAVWIDEQSHLLLRSELINEHAQAVEQLIFSDITLYDAPPEVLLQRQSEGVDYVWYQAEDGADDSLPTASVTSRWEIGFLPAGFEQDHHRYHLSTRLNDAMEQMVYSDGLASISVFVEGYTDGDETFLGFSSLGATNAYGKLVSGHHLTVVGEVPRETIIRVADSIRIKGE